jgi:hypothetical protein
MCHLFDHIDEELFVHVMMECTHLKFLAMNNYDHSKEDNVAMNNQWVSSICNGIGKPEVLDAMCRDQRIPFLYKVSKNAWTGTNDAWANKAVAEIDCEEFIVNLQSASGDDAFQYIYSHLSGIPTSFTRALAIHYAILEKLNVVHISKFTNNDCDWKELIPNLQSASGDDAFQYLHSHLSGFPTNLPRVRTICNAILAKLNVLLQRGWMYYYVS